MFLIQVVDVETSKTLQLNCEGNFYTSTLQLSSSRVNRVNPEARPKRDICDDYG